MRLVGACNAPMFSVHRNTSNIMTTGEDVGETYQIWGFWKERNVNENYKNINLWNNELEDKVVWHYDFDYNLQPTIWVIINSGGSVSYVWEGETPVDHYKNDMPPMLEFDNKYDSIIPTGGTQRTVLLPAYSNKATSLGYLDEVEDDIEDAPIPSWTANTQYSHIKDPLVLQRKLWVDMCLRRLIKNYDSIKDAHWNSPNNHELWLYTILWLRAASMVLYDHRAETLIPLALTWTVDADTGAIS